MEKVSQELFGCPYRSNGTKIHLNAALAGHANFNFNQWSIFTECCF